MLYANNNYRAAEKLPLRGLDALNLFSGTPWFWNETRLETSPGSGRAGFRPRVCRRVSRQAGPVSCKTVSWRARAEQGPKN